MKSPYPWFGGKSRIMSKVWERFGDTPNYVDPFFGSNAPLLSRSGWDWTHSVWTDGKNRLETINDKDCFVANFWRALRDDPEQVARGADYPVNEADLHARHLWLVNNQDFIGQMKSDPDYYDAKVAGWWVWGLCSWIGSGWCHYPKPPQQRPNLKASVGIHRLSQQLPHLGDAGRGINRPSQKLPHLGDAGRGINRPSQKLPHLLGARRDEIYEYFAILAARFRRVRVCCGDWRRVLGPTPTEHNGTTAIILDPPYGVAANRDKNLYRMDSLTVANEVCTWAIENGDNPKLRIALFGYEDEHSQAMPGDWQVISWQTQGGYSAQNPNSNDNNKKERIWFSPHCLTVEKSFQLKWELK